jgi:exodeoxyribonuclease V alpha subunit
VNRLAEQVLNQEGLINPDSQWYRGRPVLITRNDYNLGLYNGDIGITLRSPGSGNNELYVFFSGTSGKPRRFSPHRLPEHETVYAMTVHKSQGSEFEHVLFVLPDRDYPVLTRELLYTGITRAKESVSILGAEALLRTSISKRIDRTSGLRDALWEMNRRL